MSAATSPGTGLAYGLQRVCAAGVLPVPRAPATEQCQIKSELIQFMQLFSVMWE